MPGATLTLACSGLLAPQVRTASWTQLASSIFSRCTGSGRA